MSIGNNIKRTRVKLGWSQNDLAEKCSIGRSSIANYEQGIRTPDYAVVEKIAHALNVTPQFLCGWEDEDGNLLPNVLSNKDYLLTYVSKEDKDIIKWANDNNLFEQEYYKMDEEKEALKVLLNSFGYDLKLNKNGYSLLYDCGMTDITEDELNILMNSTKEYLEFNTKKLANEKFGWKDGVLHISATHSKEQE